MKVINLSETPSVLGRFLADLRDVNIQKDPMRFRRNLERIGEIEAYEISKVLNYQTENVQTPLGEAPTPLCSDKIVLGTIFRAGLPHHQGFLNYFDRAENAFVSAYRYYKDKDCKQVGTKIEYIASPDLNGKVLIIADPMLALGRSMALACEAFQARGMAKEVHLACVIAAQAGVDYIQETFKDCDNVTLWCAAIDPILNEHAYIVPGLGDAGDLAFGEKL